MKYIYIRAKCLCRIVELQIIQKVFKRYAYCELTSDKLLYG